MALTFKTVIAALVPFFTPANPAVSVAVSSALASGPEPVTCAGPFLAERPGELPNAGPVVVSGVELPAGRPVPELGLWITDEPAKRVREVWGELAAEFNETGLWPMLMYPWWLAEYRSTPLPAEGDADAETIIRRWWGEAMEELGDRAVESTAPIGTQFPGLTPRQSACTFNASAPLPGASEIHIALVSVARPADVVAVLGWHRHVDSTSADVRELVTVLRSWEDRLALYPIAADPGETLTLRIERPPQIPADRLLWEAELLAAEPHRGEVRSLGEWAATGTNEFPWLN